MKFKFFCRAVFAATALLAISAAANADTTIVSKFSLDMSKLRTPGLASSQIQATLRNMGLNNMTMTTYVSGTKLKTVTPSSISILDVSAKKETVYVIQTKQYMEIPLRSSSLHQSANVKDMHVDKVIAGCNAHLYKVHVLTAAGIQDGYVWTTQDLSDVDNLKLSAGEAVSGSLGEINGLTGTPLKYSLSDKVTIIQKQNNTVTTKYDTTSISHDPIPDSTFDAPEGYTQMTMPSSVAKSTYRR
jgi:hypothetical protein